MLAANRANSLKSTGPRTTQGKARVALNSLRHGGYAVALPQRLVQAGDHRGAAQCRWFCWEIAATFGVSDAADRRQAEQLAARAWCLARKRGRLWSKAGICFRMSGKTLADTLSIPIPNLLRIRIEDSWRRIGLVFWVQRPRYWTLERRIRILLGNEPVALPPPSYRLEQRWRRRRFRARKPGLWKQQELEKKARWRGSCLR